MDIPTRLHINTGFSLIELMVVVAILSVITAIAIPVYNGYTKNAYLTECANEVHILKMAQQEYFLENNVYFPDPAGTLDTSANTVAAFTAIENASGGIYAKSYSDADVPTANCTYRVTSTTGPDAFSITATGQNQLTASETFTETN